MAIVREFVIVPQLDIGEIFMHRLLVGIAAVNLVKVAVVIDILRHRASGRKGRGRAHRVALRGLINVIAQVYYVFDIFQCQVVERCVVAVVVVLADDVADLERKFRRSCRQGLDRPVRLGTRL
jgi:hypothetical protein